MGDGCGSEFQALALFEVTMFGALVPPTAFQAAAVAKTLSAVPCARNAFQPAASAACTLRRQSPLSACSELRCLCIYNF